MKFTKVAYGVKRIEILTYYCDLKADVVVRHSKGPGSLESASRCLNLKLNS